MHVYVYSQNSAIRRCGLLITHVVTSVFTITTKEQYQIKRISSIFFISEFCLKGFHNEHYAGPPINQLAYTWTNIVACIWALRITLLNKLPLVQGRGYSSLSVTAVFGRNIN